MPGAFSAVLTSVTAKRLPNTIFKSQKNETVNFLFGVTTFGVTMTFEWDEAKNRSNSRKHGLDFAEAEEMFRGILLVRPDMREDYGEERWIGIGMIQERFAFVAFAQPSADTIRIISLRRANHEERKEYEKAIADGLEAG
jgi:uncharacterized DUF497 family protein